MSGSDTPEDNGARPGEMSEADRKALRERVEALGQKLRKAEGGEETARVRPSADTSADGAARGAAFSAAFKITSELVVGVVVGAGLGWLAGGFFGSWPVGLVIGLFLGFAAGLTNVVRSAQKLQSEAEPMQKAAKPSAADEDDD